MRRSDEHARTMRVTQERHDVVRLTARASGA